MGGGEIYDGGQAQGAGVDDGDCGGRGWIRRVLPGYIACFSGCSAGRRACGMRARCR